MADRLAAMPNVPGRLDANYANAKLSLAASVREVERQSKRRFAELRKLPASTRIGHMTDPALTPTDALRLTRSLQSNVTSRRIYRAPLSVRMLAVIRWLRLGRIFSPTPLFFLSIAAIYSGIVWRNTAHWVAISRPIEFTLQYSDGSGGPRRMETRFLWQLLGIAGDRATIRLWIPGQGYARIEVPSSIIVP
jgi:hypothetical protein